MKGFYGSKKLNKCIATIFVSLTFFISISPIFSKTAEAQWITWDPGNFVPNLADTVKDYGLDAVAWAIVNKVIERMSKATVTWINGGFKGSPAYISDPEKYFMDIGDKVAGQFIFTHPYISSLCSPIQNKVRITLTKNYIGRDNDVWQCKLTEVGKNLDDFVNDFNNGGWDSFFTVSQSPGTSPLGAYLEAESELFRQIAKKDDLKKQELNQGNGFLSWKDCAQWSTPTSDALSVADVQNQGQVDENGVPTDNSGALNQEQLDAIRDAQIAADMEIADSPVVTDAFVPTCLREQTNTPGSVISDQLNKTLGLGGDKLAVADEINEIVSSLLNQLVGKIVGGLGKGLRNLSKPDSSNQNEVFTNDLGQSLRQAPVEGYYCFDDDQNSTNTDGSANQCYDTDPNFCRCPDAQDTEALKQEPFNPYASPTGGTLVSPEDILPLIPGATQPPPAEEPPPTEDPNQTTTP